MNSLVGTLFFHLGNLGRSEEGQDLVEYALVVALIAFGAVAGMGYLANGNQNDTQKPQRPFHYGLPAAWLTP